MLRADREDRGRAAGMEQRRGRPRTRGDRRQRRHRVAGGTADRRLRPDRGRCCAAIGVVSAAPPAAIRARGIPVRWGAAALLFLLASLVLGLGIGPVNLGAGPIVESTLSHLPFVHVHSPLSGAEDAILWQLRAPRVVLGALVGGMLAIAGSAYQGVFPHPLADPYLLGVAAGAGLGATIAIAYGRAGGSGSLLPVAAFAGAALGVSLA